MKKTLLFSLMLFSITLYSQRNAEPNSSEIAVAKNLKELYEDSDIVVLNSITNISFDYNSGQKKVIVHKDVEESLMNIAHQTKMNKAYFYNTQIDIEKFTIHYKTGKKAWFSKKDEAYNNSGIFHSDARVKYIELPFPTQGYQYTVNYKERVKDAKYFTSLYFIDEYPTIQKQVRIELPNWLDLEIKELNFDGYEITKTSKKDPKSNNLILTYTIKNIPAGYQESNTQGRSYIYPHLLFLTKSFTANGTKHVLFEKTQDLYNWYHSLTENLENNNTAFKAKVATLVANAANEDEKIKNIFYWVQDNIRYIAFEDGIAGFKPAEASDVYTKKYGDCKGMANLTKQMLVEAGFDARLVWIGTKRIAYKYKTPTLAVDNHMICAVIHNKDTIFLDATETYNPLGEYAYRIQDKEALIENKDTFILKKIPNKKASFNQETMTYKLTLDNENIKGTASKKYDGESRTRILYITNSLKNNDKKEAVKSFLSKNDFNISVSDIKVSDTNDREAELTMEYAINLKNKVSTFDGETYISLNVDSELSDFDFSKRKHAYAFNAKKSLKSITVFTIPKNLKVSYLPESIAIKNTDFEISISYEQQGDKIIYTKKILISDAIIAKANFEQWNAFNKKISAIYNDQIILIKK